MKRTFAILSVLAALCGLSRVSAAQCWVCVDTDCYDGFTWGFQNCSSISVAGQPSSCQVYGSSCTLVCPSCGQDGGSLRPASDEGGSGPTGYTIQGLIIRNIGAGSLTIGPGGLDVLVPEGEMGFMTLLQRVSSGAHVAYSGLHIVGTFERMGYEDGRTSLRLTSTLEAILDVRQTHDGPMFEILNPNQPASATWSTSSPTSQAWRIVPLSSGASRYFLALHAIPRVTSTSERRDFAARAYQGDDPALVKHLAVEVANQLSVGPPRPLNSTWGALKTYYR